MEEKVFSFLARNNLLTRQIDDEKLLSFFMSEMDKGLSGQESSLAMIPTYVSEVDKVPAGERVIVLDAGGTNFRTCLVSFDDEGRPSMEDFRKVGMPGVKNEVSRKEFFSILADNVERFIDKCDRRHIVCLQQLSGDRKRRGSVADISVMQSVCESFL